jgi:geranylgeranyl diphosphate synthase type I
MGGNRSQDFGQDMMNNPDPGPTLPAMFARYREVVEEELAQAVPASTGSSLSTLMRYHLGWVDPSGQPAATPASQGKALRPTLCMFACEALEGDPARAAPAAAAMELIHNFSLLHDDIQDQDVERRHQATVWSLWGIPRALVAGDAMQSLGDLEMLRCHQSPVTPAVALQVSEILSEGYLEMIEGQCMDLGFESRTDITTGDYLRMIAGKTGALIRSAVHVGALLATEDEETTRAFASFGSHLGRAFQIRDDYLGIWGDEATLGKATGNDIRRRKKSYPVVYALERAAGAALNDLQRIYRQPELEEDDVQRVLAVLDEVGAREHSQALTESAASRALDALAPVTLPEWARMEAEELVDFLARREY